MFSNLLDFATSHPFYSVGFVLLFIAAVGGIFPGFFTVSEGDYDMLRLCSGVMFVAVAILMLLTLWLPVWVAWAIVGVPGVLFCLWAMREAATS